MNMNNINDQLMDAAGKGYVEEVSYCLGQEGCNPLFRGGSGYSALMWAAHQGRESCVRLLLPVSDPLAKCDEGRSALMWAARYGHESCVMILLPQSDVWDKDKHGCSARQLSKVFGHLTVVEMINAHIAKREGDIISDHISSEPKRKMTHRTSTPRI